MRKPRASRQKISHMLDLHRLRLLELGAPGRLLTTGEIQGVMPLDDSGLLDRANPVSPGGKVRLDSKKLKDRRDAQVKSIMANGVFGLIVLGWGPRPE